MKTVIVRGWVTSLSKALVTGDKDWVCSEVVSQRIECQPVSPAARPKMPATSSTDTTEPAPYRRRRLWNRSLQLTIKLSSVEIPTVSW